jgi:hypothetical protein
MLSPAERSIRGQIAANARWAREPDRLAATAAGRRAMFEHFLDLVDPNRQLPEKQRIKMAENARAAHLAKIRLKSLKVRKMRAEADLIEQEIEEMGGAE